MAKLKDKNFEFVIKNEDAHNMFDKALTETLDSWEELSNFWKDVFPDDVNEHDYMAHFHFSVYQLFAADVLVSMFTAFFGEDKVKKILKEFDRMMSENDEVNLFLVSSIRSFFRTYHQFEEKSNIEKEKSNLQ